MTVLRGPNTKACSVDLDLVSLLLIAGQPLLFTLLRAMLCECAPRQISCLSSYSTTLTIRSTMDAECHITSDTADCMQTIAGPEANDPGIMTGVFSGISDTYLPVTITAGLEKIQAAGTASATGSSATSGTAEPSGSATSGPSETGASASSATGTGASASASSTSASNSTASSGAVAGAGQNLVLAGLSGVVGLVLAL